MGKVSDGRLKGRPILFPLKKPMPHFPTYKQRGEWVELKFMTEAAERGFNVMQPQGDSARYDVVVERDGRFQRVQVKSTSQRFGIGGYRAATHRRLGATYAAGEIDLLVVYVLPCKAWYIIPGALVVDRPAITLYPNRDRPWQRGHLFEPFRDAWHLLDAA